MRFAFFFALLLAVAAGCAKPPQALTAEVKTALANEAGLKTLQIEVDATGGVVTLKGQVEDDHTKQRLQEVVRTVPGVTWVQNQVLVAPRSG